MDLRQLRYFVAIVEEGGFSRAAQRLRIAQPALSLHVRRMEEALGTPLLIRGPGGVTPTEAGTLLVGRARPLLADFDRLQDDLRHLGCEPSGTVRIGLPGTISAMLAVPLIAAVRSRHPRIRIVIAEAMSGFVAEWMEDGRVDLGVLYGTTRSGRLTLLPLIEEDLVLLLPPGRAVDTPPGIGALTAMPLILPSSAHGLRRMIEEQLHRAGTSVEPAIEVDSYASIKRLVSDGFGCSVLPFHAVRDEAARGALDIRALGQGLCRQVCLASPDRAAGSRASTAVRRILCETVAGLLSSGVWAGARALEGVRDLVPDVM